MKSIFNINTNTNTKLSNEELSVENFRLDKERNKNRNKVFNYSQEGFFGLFKDKKEEDKSIQKEFNLKEHIENLYTKDSYDINLPFHIKDVKSLVRKLDVIIRDLYPFFKKDIERTTKGVEFINHVGKDIVKTENIKKLYDIVKIDVSKLKGNTLPFKDGIEIDYFDFFNKDVSTDDLIKRLLHKDDVDRVSNAFEVDGVEVDGEYIKENTITTEKARKIVPLYTIYDIIPKTHKIRYVLHSEEHVKTTINKSDSDFNNILDKFKDIIKLSDEIQHKVENLINIGNNSDKKLQTYLRYDAYKSFSALLKHANYPYKEVGFLILRDIEDIIKQ